MAHAISRPRPSRRRLPRMGIVSMDYAYYAPAADSSLASTIASVVGVLLMFGRQLARSAEAQARLAVVDFGLTPARLARDWLMALGLLALPAISPRSGLVATMRGVARIEAEVDRARADG